MDHEAVLDLDVRGRVLRDALAVLTQDERQAIETAFFSELTYAEAALRLNQPLGTMKTRIRSGLEKLRQALAAGVKPGTVDQRVWSETGCTCVLITSPDDILS